MFKEQVLLSELQSVDNDELKWPEAKDKQQNHKNEIQHGGTVCFGDHFLDYHSIDLSCRWEKNYIFDIYIFSTSQIDACVVRIGVLVCRPTAVYIVS